MSDHTTVAVTHEQRRRISALREFRGDENNRETMEYIMTEIETIAEETDQLSDDMDVIVEERD